MKNIKRKNLLIASSVVFLSAVISIGIAVPIGKSAYYRNQSEQLLKYSDQKSEAKSFAQNSQNQQEILQSISQLNLKAQFADTLTAKNAVDLFYDKTYNFDLNSLVDFKPLEDKFAGFNFKLLAPKDKKDLKIENNTLSNLAINVQNPAQNINYNVKFDLKFSSHVKNSEIDPDNVNVVLELVNDELIKDKTASEIVILFNSKFIQNKKSNSDQQALLKTIAEFGSISFFNKQTNDLILPLAFDLEPNLKDSKLFFSKVDDATGQANLDLSLIEKYSKKKSKIALEFKNLSTINESYASKFAQIFKDNYTFNDEIAKFLASSNLTPLDLISKPLPDSAKNHSIFKDHQPSSLDFWFKKPESASQAVPESSTPDSGASNGSISSSGTASSTPAQPQTVSVSTLTDRSKSPQQEADSSSETNGETTGDSENPTETQPTESTGEDSATDNQESKTEETPSPEVPKVETREDKLKKSFSEILHNFQISEFKIQPVKIELSKEDQEDPIKKQAIPLRLTLNGNFISSETFPGGLNFNSNNELEYSFNFNYNISDKVYGAYFQNALDNITKTNPDGSSSLKIENLEFKVKDDQKITVFAKTIDQTIEHIRNKKIELSKIKEETKQLSDLLDFIAQTKAQTNATPAKINVSSLAATTPFEEEEKKEEEEEEAEQKKEEKTETEKTEEKEEKTEQKQSEPAPSQSPGKLLSELFDNLLASNLPDSSSIILDTGFENEKFALSISIWLGDDKLKEIKIPIADVLKNNKPFEFLQEETKLHFFVDAESLITENSGSTASPIDQNSNPNKNQIPISSIKSIDSQKLEFKDYDDKKNPVPSGRRSKLKPYLDVSQGGIFLSHDGLKVDFTSKKDDIKNPTFVLAFKSAQNFSTSQAPFYLVQGWKEDKSGKPFTYGDNQKIDFGIKIRRYEYDKDKINNLEVQIGDETANPKNVQKIDHHTALVDTVTERQENVNRFVTRTVVDKVSESKNTFTPGASDFLDNKLATSLVVFRLLDADEKDKKIMELTLYSSIASNPYEPVFSVKKTVNLVSSLKFSDIKYYILGKLATEAGLSGTSGAVILKSAAVFESIENQDKSELLNKLFIDRYFDLNETKN
ncbi:P110/LppT family adhesin N-terminal domain [Mesomycoplasma ovipneumoniae]|uniref:P110/LppT family adhesin N-terminal domain n=1 Tax=Mesomycoplasma ovipneumoniae TaxID=29562 RepID=A0AAW6Q7N7_9BACT|nr:P110/LppT family adhesin N-terminal domain [Mesomycoplasma ovipneumoniae]MDF9627389.1 P110/LppT family adhesin N-terminal domain [Mesomycoplasma ovipneumoniae]MDO4157500.1 P110/LppT family adhesin N-terminal domain [Mesomycoplasma ovipneumoniae]MDO4158587.1 P110/LppT family adhesin N-terminal domain [Mesomycoplasma ovipneumoniae]MDO6821507.1 P110/LppT family adhesin N-terminal domain [Mesomycoplasma ovipneumoniae]MDO6856073.1 P110/LppT family adhesin N-terminal domain [Mesomycoplasma ovipne